MSGGFFVFQREFLHYLTDEPELTFERAPLRNLARDGQLAVFVHKGFWMGMDTSREFTALNQLWAAGEAPWKLWDEPAGWKSSTGLPAGSSSRIWLPPRP